MMLALGTFTPTSTTVVRHQHADPAVCEGGHDAVLFGGGHLAVDQADSVAEHLLQRFSAALSSGDVQHVGLGHERADPERLRAALYCGPQAIHDLIESGGGGCRGGDRLSARRLLIQARDIEIAIDGQLQGAGDRRSGESQHMHRSPFFLQPPPLGNAEPVLFIDDGETEIVEDHIVLKQGVSADRHRHAAGGDLRELGGSLDALVSSRQENSVYPYILKGFRDGLEVLSRQNFGGRHQGGLQTGARSIGHGQHGYNGLARPDIALDDPRHAPARPYVRANLRQTADLSAGEGERQAAFQARGEAAGLDRRGGVGAVHRLALSHGHLGERATRHKPVAYEPDFVEKVRSDFAAHAGGSGLRSTPAIPASPAMRGPAIPAGRGLWRGPPAPACERVRGESPAVVP